MANPVMKPGTWSGERPMSPNVASAQSRWARRRAARSSAVLGTRKHLLTGSPVDGDGKVITSRCSGEAARS